MNNKKMPGIPEVATNEDKARAYLESLLWKDGPVCPHCKSKNVYRMTAKATSTKPGRAGLLRCRECKKQFTVTVNTIFEGSHIPLHKWLMAVHFLTASKKGMSAHQLHRMLGISYKSAWFMAHRLRYAVSQGPLSKKLRGTVEVDETYVGGKQENRSLSMRSRGIVPRKMPVVALVSRSGRVKSFAMHRVSSGNLKASILTNVSKDSAIYTDGKSAYDGIGKFFAKGHKTVDHHRFQYVRSGGIHTNSVESYFSIMKRAIMGTFHHIGGQHLDQYCGEFAFKWNTRKMTDTLRATTAIQSVTGKRLLYRVVQEQGAF